MAPQAMVMKRQGKSGLDIAIALAKIAPELGKVGHFNEQAYHKGHGHEEQGKGKNGIELANNLINGQHGGQNVIDKNSTHPAHGGSTQVLEQEGRTVNEDYSHHHQQKNGENQHAALSRFAKVITYELWQSGSVVAHAQHA